MYIRIIPAGQTPSLVLDRGLVCHINNTQAMCISQSLDPGDALVTFSLQSRSPSAYENFVFLTFVKDFEPLWKLPYMYYHFPHIVVQIVEMISTF